eukprot:4203057-Pyramimonas_sp.AAC.1
MYRATDGGALVSAMLLATPTHSRNALAHAWFVAAGPDHTPKYSAASTIGIDRHRGTSLANRSWTVNWREEEKASETGTRRHLGILRARPARKSAA